MLAPAFCPRVPAAALCIGPGGGLYTDTAKTPTGATIRRPSSSSPIFAGKDWENIADQVVQAGWQ
jgi:hypothetical protein